MPGKHLTNFLRRFGAGLAVATFLPGAFADEASPAPKFLGSQSCSSSSCHGGASEKSNQYTIWSTHDYHHARPYATLETARAERLAEGLKIGAPAQSARCTVCHAPFQTVPAERLGPDATVTEGVSCESCHGPAENWLRSHTRTDYTHADRVAAGMRDLQNLYVRANTCVACHQNLDPDIRAAGHPELMFEMDGQSATMPRHWREAQPASARWFIGQAAAAREMSWQLANENSPDPVLVERWAGLVWALQSVKPGNINLSAPTAGDFKQAQENFARLAREAAEPGSHAVNGKAILGALASTGSVFDDKGVSTSLQGRRAERLVLALDRLLPELDGAKTNSVVNQSLNQLFADAQSLPDFDPEQFAKDLNTFHSSVAGFLETK